MDRDDLSSALATLRTLRGMSRRDVALAAGIKPQALSDYEKGKQSPSRRTRERLAGALRVTPVFLEDLAALLPAIDLTAEQGAPPVGLVRAVLDLAREADALLSIDALRPPATPGERTAQDLWERLRPYSTAERRAVISEVEEFRSSSLALLLCEESVAVAAGDAGQSLDLALLALFIVERVPGRDAWRWRLAGYVWAFPGEPLAVRAAVVYGNFFAVFRVRPLLGRWLREEESWPGPPPVAVLSYRLWRELGADPHIVGRSLHLDGRERTVAGVMPRGFQYPSAAVDLWIPIRWQPGQVSSPLFRGGHSLRPIGRLRPEASYARARSFLLAISGRLERQYPATHRRLRAGFTPLREWLLGRTETALLALLGASLFVLLIACVNVANLQLVRAIGRSREIAVRLALGASRRDLVGPALAEGFLLSALGTLGGLGLAYGSTRVLLAVAGPQLPRAEEISVDGRVLVFAVGCGIASALLASLAPALHSPWARGSAGAGPATATRGVARFQSILAVAEVALAALLAFQAASFVRGFVALVGVDPGFRSQGVLTLKISLPPTRYRSQQELATFWSRLLERSEALPGVRWAGLADGLPLGGLQGTVDLYQEGRPEAEHGEDLSHRVVSPDYFHALGVPLVSGRSFSREDGESAPRVVVINQSAAHSYFRGESPLGRRIAFEPPVGTGAEWHTVVGVVGDERVEGLTSEARPEVYETVAQAPQLAMSLILQSRSSPARSLPQLRQEFRAIDPMLALAEIRTMEDIVARAILPARALTLLALFFAVLALVLAAVGVYGVMSYTVAQRSRELGIRMALGSTRRQVFLVVLSRALIFLAAGSGMGILGGLAVSRALASLRIQQVDHGTAGAVVLLLLAVGIMAGYLPARRAARIDPATTVRTEG